MGEKRRVVFFSGRQQEGEGCDKEREREEQRDNEETGKKKKKAAADPGQVKKAGIQELEG